MSQVPQEKRRPAAFIYGLIAVGLALSALAGFLVVPIILERFQSENEDVSADDSDAVRPLHALPGPLSSVDFSKTRDTYPAGWPAELEFPGELALVQAAEGRVPIGNSRVWVAKLTFDGSPEIAAEGIVAFLIDQGWIVQEANETDGGGLQFTLQRDLGAKIAIVIVDPYPDLPEKSRLLITAIQNSGD